MLARALIVLLVVLNLGVAAWWVSRPDSAPPQQLDALDGVPTLRLPSEARAADRGVIASPPVATLEDAMPAATPSDAAAATGSAAEVATPDADASVASTSPPALATPADDATSPTAAPRCFALGPFADPAAVARARSGLQGQTLRLRERSVAATAARGWRVWLPPLADRAAAQAMVERLKAAGFSDLFVLNAGADSNGIALGRFGSESSAREHESALRTAGFADARAEPIGGDAAGTLIDVAVAQGITPTALRQLTGATRAGVVDCATVP